MAQPLDLSWHEHVHHWGRGDAEITWNFLFMLWNEKSAPSGAAPAGSC